MHGATTKGSTLVLLLRSDEFFKHLDVLLLRFNGFDRLPEFFT
ncbi:hypothetical protein KSD_82060 [Ktedonobacter sp. SOSP1-85]|nr:hypothetical protein KSD_82060 [Ktedonobacter sp. SOSP1-85]